MKIHEYIRKSLKNKRVYPQRYLQLSCEFFRQTLLVPNNAKSLHVYQIVHLTNFLTFSLININQNIRNKRKFRKNQRGCTYKITHMSVAGYPIHKLKPRTIFLSFCVLLSF